MYCTSTQMKLLSGSELQTLEQKGMDKFPRPYMDFMKNYGSGTYGGAICIYTPDFNSLKNFAEYDFWNYEEAPITKEQLHECAVIGNSIDGQIILNRWEISRCFYARLIEIYMILRGGLRWHLRGIT